MKRNIVLALVSITIFISGVYSYNILKVNRANISKNMSIKSNAKKKIIVSGTIAGRDKKDLIVDSDIIVSGKVENILASKWSNPDLKKGENVRNVLQTDIVIKIKKIFKGIPYNTDEVAVRIDKGQDKDTVYESEGYPDFEKGEEVVLFLSKDDSDIANPNENYYVLTGMLQGKYTLNKNDTTKDEFDMNELGKNEKISLSNFDKEIEDTLKEYEKSGVKKLTKEEIKEINKKTVGE